MIHRHVSVSVPVLTVLPVPSPFSFREHSGAVSIPVPSPFRFREPLIKPPLNLLTLIHAVNGQEHWKR